MGAETANACATVYRGTSENQFGDVTDADIPLIQGLPVTLIETGKQVQDPSSATPRTIRQVLCIVPDYAGLTSTDRILDEATGQVYIVIGVTRPPTLIGAPTDITLDLKRVSAQTA